LQLVDVTKDFLQNDKEKELLTLINATVSHELRTPLNFIVNTNAQVMDLVQAGDKSDH